mmetsp:Transcript_35874/g.94159  ORF Transcript_35874/g.94159 Transcript_35874/m.94159 type:complete len:245 (+) Transcript_35874:17-751(+)
MRGSSTSNIALEWPPLLPLTVVLTLATLVLALALAFEVPDSNHDVVVVAWLSMLVLNTALSSYRTLLERTRCSMHRIVRPGDEAASDDEDGDDGETCILVDELDSFEINNDSSVLPPCPLPILFRAVATFVALVAAICIAFASLPLQLQGYHHHLLASKVVLIFLWALCPAGEDSFAGNSTHCMLGMVMFAIYLVLDFQHSRSAMGDALQFAVDNGPVQCAILLSLDLCGLFLQTLRWGATSTM